MSAAMEIDLHLGECTAFDIDGQLLHLVDQGTGFNEWVALPTGSYDLPRLLALARRRAELDGYELTTDDHLLELANHALMEEYGSWEPPRWLRWLFRLADDAVPERPEELFGRPHSPMLYSR